MNIRILESVAFFYAALAVICAAMGAHLLKDQWHDADAPRQFATATRILFWHSIGIWICSSATPVMRFQGVLMAVSTAVFCGAVYMLALGGGVILGSGGSRRRIWNDRELVDYGGIQISTQVPLNFHKSLHIITL